MLLHVKDDCVCLSNVTKKTCKSQTNVCSVFRQAQGIMTPNGLETRQKQ